MCSFIIKAEKNCQWHPIYRNSNDNGVGPSEPMQENFRRTPYSSLVREAIQNSLDVVKDNSMPMEIRFSIGSIDSKNFPKFFEIRKHIQGCIENFPNNDKAKRIYPQMLSYIDSITRPGGKLYFIRISDHNTQGMHYENPEDNDAPFYAFVRSAGVSSKNDESAGGSFGFGKAAYFYLSPIRTILVSTKTDNNKYYFEGVTSLCSHKIDGQTVSNIVYYDNNDGQPTTEYDKIPERFQRKDCNGNEYGSGTDIFIMGIDFENYGTESSIYDQMFISVLENFWLAVLEDKLIVKIGKGDQERVINSENITNLMMQYDENDTNIRKNYNPRPYFEAVKYANCSDKFIHTIIDLNIIPDLKNWTSKNWGHIHYYFHINKKAQNRIVYMRGLRMKVFITPGRNGEGYYGVIVCPDGECNTILRQTEDPAHSKWDANRLDNKNERKIAKIILDIIEREKNHIIRNIFKLDEIETIKIKGLEQYLYIPTETEDDEDDNIFVSSVIGKHTGIFLSDGFSPTTEADVIKNGATNISEVLTGKVLMNSYENINQNQLGTILTGRGDKKIKNPHTNKHISAARPKDHNIIDKNGNRGHILEMVSVRYRSFAQKNGTLINHKLIIYSPKYISNGQINLFIGSESSDSKIKISDSSKGNISGNSITNLQLVEGKNELTIHFIDNLQHSLKLDVYEIK